VLSTEAALAVQGIIIELMQVLISSGQWPGARLRSAEEPLPVVD